MGKERYSAGEKAKLDKVLSLRKAGYLLSDAAYMTATLGPSEYEWLVKEARKVEDEGHL